MTVRFTIPGPPVGKGRPRFVRATGRTYTDEKTASYESLVKMAYSEAARGSEMFKGPVMARIEAYYPIPTSMGKKARKRLEVYPYCPKKPDADNLAKACLDSLNGLAWADDNCVTTLIVSKRYSIHPCVDILLTDELEQGPFCGAGD